MSRLVHRHTEQKSLPVGPGQPQNHGRQQVVEAVVVLKPLSSEAVCFADNQNRLFTQENALLDRKALEGVM